MCIVDKGVLKGFIYNTAVAKRAGVASTGNASRGGFTSLPGIGPHNFVHGSRRHAARRHRQGDEDRAVAEGRHRLRDQPGERQLQRRRVEGLWIENGQVAFPVKGLTIAGTAAEMLNGIDLVGTEVDLNRAIGGADVQDQGDADRWRVAFRIRNEELRIEN